MALILKEKYRLQKINYFNFIASRFLRIFPSYFVVLFLTIALSLLSTWSYGKSIEPVVLWWQNWVRFDGSTKVFLVTTHLGLLGQDAFYFLGLDKFGDLYLEPDLWMNQNEFYKFMLVPQAWSLSLELYFYLLVPFLVRRSALILALIILMSLGIRLLLVLCFGWKSDPWAYRFFPSEFALFLCGAAVYRVYGVAKVKKMNVRAWLGWCLIGLAGCIALLINHYPGGFIMWKNIGFFVAIVLVLPFLFNLTKRSKIDSFIGELSYPMYLCHMLVIWLFQLVGVVTGVQWSVGVLLVTLLLSVILYWYVDRNISAYRHKKFPATT